MTETHPTPIALSIAGSDPSAGAGIQADLRMFFSQGVFGTTVLTALTAQNPREVTAVKGLEASFVEAQIETILKLPVKAIKTGMLWSSEIISTVAQMAEKNPHIPLVCDPVMIATSGAKLISDHAITRYTQELIPKSTLLTPNLDEAEVLLQKTISRATLTDAAKELHDTFGCSVLLKGGHLEGKPTDVLFHEKQSISWTHERINHVNTHGSGCMLSAAIAAFLAKGLSLPEAVDSGLRAVHIALSHPVHIDHDLSLSSIEACR